MSHIPETDLILYAFDHDAVSPERGAEIRLHVSSCSDCQSALDFFEIAEKDMGDGDVWERTIGSATYASLMEYGALIAREDSEAAELLADYLDHPANVAWSTLVSRRAFHTGGVVRKLTSHAHSLCERRPLQALTFAENAISIAEVLPDDIYPANAIYQLRGTAWKELANTQMLLGRLPNALVSLDRAERAYRHLPAPALGVSMVSLVRAGVLYEQGRLTDADMFAEQAVHAFTHLGDQKRLMDALFLRAAIRYEMRDLKTAIVIFRQICEYAENIADTVLNARGAHGLGIAEIDCGNLSEASAHLHFALITFRATGFDLDRIAAEWGLARIVLRSGKLHDAIRRLRDVAAEFEKLGKATDAALVQLEIAEGWLALERHDQVVHVCQHIFTVFTAAGILTGALTAIAYLKEAAGQRRATLADIDAVRTFVRRAERQPALQFVRPALPD